MPKIHPTAIIDDRAELADDVEVGPWCLIEGRVTIGAGTRLLSRVSLNGPLVIGENNTIYPNATIGFAPQDLKFDHASEGAGVAIGNNNLLREGVNIHRATGQTPTTLGDDNYLMVNAHLGHDCVVGNRVMMANNAAMAGHVTLGDQVIIGGGAAIHQFVTIGRLSMVSGLQGIGQDLPPFCTVYVSRYVGSLNIVGLRRNGYRDHITHMKTAFQRFFMEGHTNPIAIASIENDAPLIADPLVREFVDFIKQSKRGIPHYQSRSD